MHLERFVDDNPGCLIRRPDLSVPGLLAVLPAAGIAIAMIGAIGAALQHNWLAAIGWTSIAAALIVPAVRYGRRFALVYSLYRRGHASFAVAEDDLLLVDAVGNAVVVAIDRVTRLEVDGDEARLRTDSELQGVVYAVMFQLFDEDVPGPSADNFFDMLAPRVRQRCPHAMVVRHAPAEGALYT